MIRLLCTFLAIFFAAPTFGQALTAAQLKKARPFVLGIIQEIRSKELGENRTLNIYLPEGYDPKAEARYPVIYLLDGSADEDFIHVAGLVQFNSFEWVNQVPKSIVVGIATVDRRRDFTFPSAVAEDKKAAPTAGGSAKFMAFLEKELQPYIEQNFKTTPDKTLIGQSLGGLLAAEVLFKKTVLFNKYIIISPSLWWNNGSLLEQPFTDLKRVAVYIGVGKEGLTPTNMPRVMEVDANLLADKIKQAGGDQVNVFFDYLPQEDHGSIMHQAISNAFKALYSKQPGK